MLGLCEQGKIIVSYWVGITTRGLHWSAKTTKVVFFVIVDYIDQPFGWPPVEILSLAFYTHLFSAFSCYS